MSSSYYYVLFSDFKMFKTLPKEFGKFKQVSPEHYDALHQMLDEFLPRTRRLLSDLVLNGLSGGHFYVPVFDDPQTKRLSGMVISLFGEYPDPTAAFSYFSKEEDVSLVRL